MLDELVVFIDVSMTAVVLVVLVFVVLSSITN